MTYARAQWRALATAALVSIPVATCITLKPSIARAAPEDEDKVAQAVARYKRGQDLYNERNFPAALIEFRKAYEIAPNYRVLYNIGQVCYQMQDYVCALHSLEQYLSEGNTDIKPERREEVQKELAALKNRIGYLDVRTTNVEGAEVSVDDVVAGTTPLKQPITVSAGRHKVVIIMNGRVPVTRTVDVAGQDTAKLDIALAAITEKQQVIIRDPGQQNQAPNRSMTALSWIGYGVGVGMLAGGAVTGAMALGSADDVKTKIYPDESAADSDKSRTSTLATVADVLLIGGVVVVAATTILTFVVPRAPKGSSTAVLPTRITF